MTDQEMLSKARSGGELACITLLHRWGVPHARTLIQRKKFLETITPIAFELIRRKRDSLEITKIYIQRMIHELFPNAGKRR